MSSFTQQEEDSFSGSDADEENVEQAYDPNTTRERLIIEKRMKSTMIGRGGTTIKRIQRYAHVHISKLSQDLEQAIITGQRENVHNAVDEFMDIASEHKAPVLIEYNEYLKRTDNLNSTLNDHQQKVDDLKKDLDVKEGKVQELTSKYNRQKDLGIQYVRGQNQLSNELNEMNKKYEEQKMRADDYRNNMNSHIQQNEVLSGHLKNATPNNKELQNQTYNNQQEIQGLKNDIIVKELKIQELASQNTRVKEMNIQYVNGQNELAIEFEKKKEENANLKETLSKLIDELGESNKALKESNEGLKEELATANKNITTFKNHHQQEVEDLKKDLDVKQGKVQELTSQYNRLKDLGIKYVRRQNRLSNELNDKNKKYEEQKIRVDELEKSNVELLSKNSKLEERYNTTSFEIEQPRLRVRDIEEDLVMSIEEDNDIEEQEDNPKDEAEEETKEIQEAIEIMASRKKDLATLTDKNLSLEKDNKELEDKLQESHIRKRKLEEDVTSSETENKRIRFELVSTKEENQELKRLKELHLKSNKEKEIKLRKIIEGKTDNLNLLLGQIRQQMKPDNTSA